MSTCAVFLKVREEEDKYRCYAKDYGKRISINIMQNEYVINLAVTTISQ